MATYEVSTKDPDEIRAVYVKQGFAVVRSFFAGDRIAEIRASLDRYVSQTVPEISGSDVVYEKDGSSIRNLFRMEAHEPFFRALGNDPAVLAVADSLVNGKAVLRAVQTFSKPAQVGSPVPQHQDNAYFCLSPPDAFTMWVAVDPATEENGPVHYLPGSHLIDSLEHEYSGQPGNSLKMRRPQPVDGEKAFCALMQPGDVIFHHCRVVHFSGPNRSNKPRVGMVIPYAGSHVQADEGLKQVYDSVSAKVGKPLRH